MVAPGRPHVDGFAGLPHLVAGGVHVERGREEPAEALGKDANVAVPHPVTQPGDDEVPDLVAGHVCESLVTGGERIGLELDPAPGVGRADAPAEAAPAVAVAQEIVPGHDVVALGVDGDAVQVLAARGEGVDRELGAHAIAGGVVALRADLEPPDVALPAHDEPPVGSHADRGILLAAGKIRVHLELGSRARAGGVVALAEDAVAAAVLGGALPHDDEAAVRCAGDVGLLLVAGGEGVHGELGADAGSRGVEALGPDPVVAGSVSLGAGPCHDEAAPGIDGDAGTVLAACRVRYWPGTRRPAARPLAS